MKTFNVRHAETFLWDMIDITLHILEESSDPNIPRRFYNDVLAAIENRAFGADSYELYYPYDGSPEYRRLYFGNYTIYYVIDGDDMAMKRLIIRFSSDYSALPCKESTASGTPYR